MTKATEEITKDPAEVMTLKNFRANNSDIENFYRFIHENGLRREAAMMLEYALDKVRKNRKNKRAAKTLQ
jgi:hypothetical protein